jgi:multiple sugar transport system permease protein
VTTKVWTGRGLARERWHGWFFLAPTLVFLACVILLPLAHAFWTSFHRIRGLSATFVGFANYARVLGDDVFWHSFQVSIAFVSISVAAHMLLGLGLALALDKVRVARSALRILFLTPWMVAAAVGATIWLWLLEPQFGVVNHMLLSAGLGEPGPAFASVTVVEIWRGVPFVMLLMLAGLQTIPAEQYEAAEIDGASNWQRFRWITLPNLKYLIVVASTLDIINVVRHYDIIGVMTAGGPAGATEVLPALLYNTAFRANRFGEAAAIGVLLLLVVLAFAVIYLRATGIGRSEEQR